MEFGSYSINYSMNSSCYSIRLHNMSGGECCSGREDVQYHGGNFTLLRCLWRGRVHVMRKVAFSKLKEMSRGNGRHFPNLGAPCPPDINTLFHPVRVGISEVQVASICRDYVKVWISESFPGALLVSQ